MGPLGPLHGGQIGGGSHGGLDGEGQTGRQGRHQLGQRQDALAGKQPAGAGLADERRRVGGAGHVGGGVADLRVPEEGRIDLGDVSGDAARALKWSASTITNAFDRFDCATRRAA